MRVEPLAGARMRPRVTQRERPTTQAQRRTRTVPHRVRRWRPVLALGTSLLVLIMVTAALIHAAASPVAGRQSAIDPRLILQPHTSLLTARSGRLHARLRVTPLIPGINHFTLYLDDQGRPLAGGQVTLTATMPGMRMQPLRYTARRTRTGAYVASGPITMFGEWRLVARIQRPRAAPLSATFTLSLSLPPAVLSAAAGATR